MRILRTSGNKADCLFSTIPKGLRIGCFSLQMSLSHFGAKDGQPHCISTCLRAARYKYLPILKRKIWVEKRLGSNVPPRFLWENVTTRTRSMAKSGFKPAVSRAENDD